MRDMRLTGATEGNLKNVSLTIPRNKLTVLTGVSGSGKSTLAVDVLFRECQRQYLEAMGMQGIHRPKIEALRGASPAVLINQSGANRNPRSTVGTLTDIYTDLRMVFEKLHSRACPHCGGAIRASDCPEVLEKLGGGEFKVHMDCPLCGARMDKLTRTHFSHNTREGACETCRGLGKAMAFNRAAAVDESRSLEDGAVDYWDGPHRQYQIGSFYSALAHYGAPVAPGTRVADYTDAQRAMLYHGVDSEPILRAFPGVKPPKTVSAGRFEGVEAALWRRLADKTSEAKYLDKYFDEGSCPDCDGERLCALSRAAEVEGARLPELARRPLDALLGWVDAASAALSADRMVQVGAYLGDLRTKIRRLAQVGLSYLALDRQVVTLSGGELQRVRLAAALDSDLTGILYVLDEPTAGLHPRDTAGLISVLHRLRDLENTVVVIEHDVDVMRAADHIVDIGPGAGARGGEVVGEGPLAELMAQPSSVTGAYLSSASPAFAQPRPARGWIDVRGATMHNLRGVDARFPRGCLTVVTGASGSGKSTLVFDCLAKRPPGDLALASMEQASISRMRRSNVATYSGAYDEIRARFGALPEAAARVLTAKHFSFNAPGGRCERCAGLGYVESNMLFFEAVELICPACGGDRFEANVLAVKMDGLSIADALRLPVERALDVFGDHPRPARILGLLCDVGLGYLELGQSLVTLSGGEGQRLKLARELLGALDRRTLYLMDEPTLGLHPLDVEQFIALLNRMVDAGDTVIAVEHNMQLARAADWLVDMGPEGGDRGGQLLFQGPPEELMRRGGTATAEALRT